MCNYWNLDDALVNIYASYNGLARILSDFRFSNFCVLTQNQQDPREKIPQELSLIPTSSFII